MCMGECVCVFGSGKRNHQGTSLGLEAEESTVVGSDKSYGGKVDLACRLARGDQDPG